DGPGQRPAKSHRQQRPGGGLQAARQPDHRRLHVAYVGYNIHPLIDALDDAKLAPIAAKALSHTLLMFDNFYDGRSPRRATIWRIPLFQ
ncbi:hypothetical protein FK521_30390, partial [Klebsiella pneumoniae]|nr:hypothetical protein [Klebsiella pneumoniae]